MKLSTPHIPKELDADVALSVLISHIGSVTGGKFSYSYEFTGVSQRTASGDELLVDIKNKSNAELSIKFSLKRDSLYHILPEYLFHPLDCYLGTNGDSDEFDLRYKEQEEQRNKALIYFNPFDRHFQDMKVNYQRRLNENIFSENSFLSDFISDGYGINRDNPFIKAVSPCLVWLRNYRGNDAMVETALKYAFGRRTEISKSITTDDVPFSDRINSEIGRTFDDLYCGPSFKDKVTVWTIFFHTRIDSSVEIDGYETLTKEFAVFFTAWFLPVGARLEVDFGDRSAAPILSDADTGSSVFLNYSTQLI